MKHPSSSIVRAALAWFAAAGIALTPLAEAAGNRGGGPGGVGHAGGGSVGGGSSRGKPEINHSRTDVRANNVRSTSVNNVNVDRSVNVNVDSHHGWDNDYHPVATAAAVTATVAVTSAIVGSIVNAPPPGCVPVNYGGYIYQRCGNTWYQPQGTQYVVIVPPY